MTSKEEEGTIFSGVDMEKELEARFHALDEELHAALEALKKRYREEVEDYLSRLERSVP